MRQVLSNVVRNAVQATPEPARVDLSVQLRGARLVFAVRDRGEGIEPGDEEKLFEPFFTRRVQGTGLGLAVARRIVEGHGGTIQARTHPEGGAVFTIELPREA
jgi:signal transduction histidine kinase